MAKQQLPKKKAPKTDDQDPNKETETEDTETEDEDDEDTAEAENRRINAIVTSRVKREMKGVLSTLATIQESMKTLAAASSKKTDEETEDDEDTTETPDGEKKTPVLDPKLSRKMTKLERELADERSARKKAEADRAEEQEKTKKTEMRTIFSSALTELGISDPKLLRAAVNLLEEDGVMIRDEEGKIKFKGQDKYGIETNFDPKIGLKSWVAGEGKSFVPAVDASGSGTGGSRGTGNGSQSYNSKEFGKLNDQQKAAINLERACSGLPPLGEGQ